MTAAAPPLPLPVLHMQAVNAVSLHALRSAGQEHDATGQQLRQAGLALTVRDPLRQVYLSCASRAFVMAKLARSLADTLQGTGEALEGTPQLPDLDADGAA